MKLKPIEPEDLNPPGVRPAYTEGEKTGIVRYLEGGDVLLPIPRRQACKEEGCGKIAGGESVRTDGEYLWGAFYAHYVLSHGYTFPETFFIRMKQRHFNNPPIPADEMWLLKKEAFGE